MRTPAAPAGLIAGLCLDNLDNPAFIDGIRTHLRPMMVPLAEPLWSSPISEPAGFEVTQ